MAYPGWAPQIMIIKSKRLRAPSWFAWIEFLAYTARRFFRARFRSGRGTSPSNWVLGAGDSFWLEAPPHVGGGGVRGIRIRRLGCFPEWASVSPKKDLQRGVG